MTSSIDTGFGALISQSREVITSLQEKNGAYPASPSFSAYKGFSWFRDGAFIADGISAAGEEGSASAFFDWCAAILQRYEPNINSIVNAAGISPLSDEEMLPTRFTFAGVIGDAKWWDFQHDGYGTWLWAVVARAQRYNLDTERWREAVELTVDYLLSSWRRACYDWWEEHSEQTHVSTLGCIAAGLRAVADFGLLTTEQTEVARETVTEIIELILEQGVQDGHLTKWLGTSEVDASLSALIAPLGIIPADSQVAKNTIDQIEADLTVDDGVYRFRADTFFGGGRWPLLSCFLGLAHLKVGNEERAEELLHWAASSANDAGFMPEQISDKLLAPDYEQEWIDRWGPVANPLLWSHAMFLRLATALKEGN